MKTEHKVTQIMGKMNIMSKEFCSEDGIEIEAEKH